ncbi:OmpH family outer membrane protein [Terriglobus sp.]|uniref:OmpH family outer membrane protein n=1 Tax=Terriglobus sp. TaxID=1889013 RepID=UPI003B0085FD
MNRIATVSTLAVAVASLGFSTALFAQASPQPAAAAAVKPEAIPAKIALISFEQAVFATNEGQKAVNDLSAKYQPQKTKIDGEAQEVQSLKDQLQKQPNLSDAEKATRVRNIDTKEKQLQRDGEDASAAYQQELQEVYGRIAQKVNGTLQTYANQNGFTLTLDVSGQSSNILQADPRTDITRAVIDAYNTSSGVPAQPAGASAPSAPASRTAPRATPRTTPAPR